MNLSKILENKDGMAALKAMLSLAVLFLIPEGDKFVITNILKKYEELGIEGVEFEIKSNPDLFGCPIRRARAAMDNAILYLDTSLALYKAIRIFINENI